MNKEKSGKMKIRPILVIIFILITAIVSAISFRGNYLELLEIGEKYTDVFLTNIKYKYMTIGINFIIIFLIIYITTKIIKKGIKKFFEDEKKEMPKLPNKSIALVLATVISIISSSIISEKLILLLNSTLFGIDDPIFGMDIGYFMFQKPFIELILIYAVILIIILTIYIAIYYITVFNMFFDGVDGEVLKKNTFFKQIKFNVVVISILAGILVFVRSQNIIFEKFINLNDDLKTTLQGAGLTDVTIKLWGYRLLAIIIPVSVILALIALKRKQTKRVVICFATVPIYLVGMVLTMVIFQNVFIGKNELDKEKTYINENIKYTKNAYNINIEEKDFGTVETITEQDLINNEKIASNISVVNKETTIKLLNEKETNKGYYTFKDSKLLNYNNELVYITPKEIVNNNKVYEYTHGFGVVISKATGMTKDSLEYVKNDFTELETDVNPRIYYGNISNNTVIVNSKNAEEFDYPDTSATNTTYEYDGEGGLSLNFIDRITLGLYKKEINLIFNNNIDKSSKILTNKNIIERAKKVLPYIEYDPNPYMIITDSGKLVWVLDGYTTSSNYPYAQNYSINGKKINYIRNSVKVIIDAYDGTTQFYITDKTDPIIIAYQKIYKTLFLDEKIPEDIAKNIVYPEYLYKIQSEILKRYHNVQTEVLYRNDDVWDYAKHNNSKLGTLTSASLEPYYSFVSEEDKINLGLIIPYTQYKKQNLTAYLQGVYDENQNNKLTLFKFTTANNVLGTLQLDLNLEQDVNIANEINALNVAGTKITREMMVIPVGNNLLYIESVYQTNLNELKIPILKKVIVASGNKLAIGDNTQQALQKLVSQYATDIEVENTDNTSDLIQAIIKAKNNLTTSVNNNDWELIGKDMQKLQELIDSLEKIIKEQEKVNTTVL